MSAKRLLDLLIEVYENNSSIAHVRVRRYKDDLIEDLNKKLQSELEEEYNKGFKAGLLAAKNAIVEVEEKIK